MSSDLVSTWGLAASDGLKQPTPYPPPRHIDSQSRIQQDSAGVLLPGKSTVGLEKTHVSQAAAEV